ncbi:MerR family transcriptional regulator [Rhodanobacter sp. OR444]|uniref:MerR family transcriptional regulator n=1 Tax=Rhodanobacter sp. OR444 TaxID=1076525 RepID=UPI0006853EAB|nr:MerR family transcriptional regulator [Rhodanobacter sp. OR444]
MPASYSTAEAAKLAGVTVHQARTYVTAKLVTPCGSTSSGYLLFDDGCVKRLQLIAAATRAGLLLREITGLVKALDAGDRSGQQRARREITGAIGARQAAITQLQVMVSRACGTAPAERES